MNIRELLKKHEGLRLRVYRCPAGKQTIGYGRNLEDRGISSEEAEYLLDNDIIRIIDLANGAFDWFKRLDSVRQDVVICMIFNLGLSGFSLFRKTIALIEKREFGLAATEMLNSRWAEQVGRRAYELSEMMRHGEYIGGHNGKTL